MNGGVRNFLGCSQDIFNRNLITGGEFCNKDNLHSSISVVLKELEALGFSCFHSAPNLQDDGKITLEDICTFSDLIGLLNSTWELMQNYKNCIKTLEEFQSQLQLLHTDVNQLHVVVSKQKDALDAKHQVVQNGAERERQLQVALQEEREAFKNSQEELRRVTSSACQKDVQSQHEIKRKDQEIVKLRERLIRIMSNKSVIPSDDMGIATTAPISRIIGKQRSKWKTDWDQKSKFDFFEKLHENSKVSLEALQEENIDLRDIIALIFDKLNPLVSKDMPVQTGILSSQELEHQAHLLLKKTETKIKAGNKLSKLDSFDSVLEKIPQKTSDDNKLLKELQKMFSDGKKILMETQKTQEYEGQELEKLKANLEAERQSLENCKKQLLLDSVTDALCETFVSEDLGPVWSQGSLTCTFASSDMPTHSVTAVHVGPAYNSSSRPPSQPQSRSHSRNRSQPPISKTSPKGQRPRSVHLSPQRTSSPVTTMKWSPNGNKASAVKTRRAGSVSPSGSNRYHAPVRSQVKKLSIAKVERRISQQEDKICYSDF